MKRLVGWFAAPTIAAVVLLGGCDDETTDSTSAHGGATATGGAGAGGSGATPTGGGGAAVTTTGNTGGSSASGGAGGAISVEGCPPEAPFGTEPGSVAPDATLYDCDGNEHHVHELCANEAAYLYTFAAWCPTCQAAASSGDHNALWSTYGGESFALWFVVTSDSASNAPDAAFCEAVREQYGLTMPVLYDPDGVTQSVLGMRINAASLLMTQGNVVELNGPWAISMIEDGLAEIFGY